MIHRCSTKELLAESLLELSQKKSLDKISISDITNNCSLKRESFYYHFADRYELMVWLFKYHTVEIIQTGAANEPLIDVWEKALSVIEKYRYYYQKVFQNAIFCENILDVFIESITYCVEVNNGREELEQQDMQFAIRFYASGLLRATKEWIQQPQPEPVSVISENMRSMVPHILSKYYIK